MSFFIKKKRFIELEIEKKLINNMERKFKKSPIFKDLETKKIISIAEIEINKIKEIHKNEINSILIETKIKNILNIKNIKIKNIIDVTEEMLSTSITEINIVSFKEEIKINNNTEFEKNIEIKNTYILSGIYILCENNAELAHNFGYVNRCHALIDSTKNYLSKLKHDIDTKWILTNLSTMIVPKYTLEELVKYYSLVCLQNDENDILSIFYNKLITIQDHFNFSSKYMIYAILSQLNGLFTYSLLYKYLPYIHLEYLCTIINKHVNDKFLNVEIKKLDEKINN